MRTARFRRPGTDTGGATAIAAGAAIGTANALARLVSLIASLVALVIVAGIAFVVLKANMGNSVVSSIHDAAKFLAGPFDGLFKLHDHRLGVAINWGIAALVYTFVGRLVVRLLRRY